MDMIPPHVQRLMDAAGTRAKSANRTAFGSVSIADAHKIGDEFETPSVTYVSGPAPETAAAVPAATSLLASVRRLLPF